MFGKDEFQPVLVKHVLSSIRVDELKRMVKTLHKHGAWSKPCTNMQSAKLAKALKNQGWASQPPTEKEMSLTGLQE